MTKRRTPESDDLREQNEKHVKVDEGHTMLTLVSQASRVPAVGDTVFYRYPCGEIRPAIVVNVHDAETVDLSVLTAGAADRSVVPERVVMINVNTGADMHSVPPVVFRPAVRRGEGPGEWNWRG